MEATSCVKEVPCGDTHMDWPRAVLPMEVSEVDSASLGWDQYTAETAEGLWDVTMEEYTCGIARRGITAHGRTRADLGYRHECWTWRLALRHAWLSRVWEELQQGSPRGTKLRSSKSARIRSVEGNGAASVIDTERVWCYWPPEESTREDTGSTQRL